MLLGWTAAIAVGLFSLLWVELVRDSYHVLAHHWLPLYRLHVWHHRVFRRDLTPVSTAIYQQANWYNDLPESLVMLAFSSIPIGVASTMGLPHPWLPAVGSLYALTFSLSAIARGSGLAYADELTDFTHRPGEFQQIPSNLWVNRPYHWRHHFDNHQAYYCGTLTLLDKLLGTALSLSGKRIAVTGASGSLGRALLQHLKARGARVIALTSQPDPVTLPDGSEPLRTLIWQVGREAELADELAQIDILILNHGINVHGDRDAAAIERSYEVNAFSQWRLLELFLSTVRDNAAKATKEVWVNTSEAEVNPAFSPLYELSKRTLGDLVTLRRLDAPCIIRKLILGPFKSNLNPVGVMSADWVARQVVNLAVRDTRNIIVTINPLTYLFFPFKELAVSLYFRLFSRRPRAATRGGSEERL